MATCSVDGCEKGGDMKRGMCSLHYQRWRKHGDPLNAGAGRYATPEESFLARTEPIVGDPGCIVWLGSLGTGGYGTVWVDGSHVGAHRYAYEREHGPIPDGMEVDHTCWNRSCVNVEHLRIATRVQNGQNLSGAHRGHDLPRGVYRHGKGYRARVRVDGKSLNLGTFATPELASIAASEARSIHFGIFAGNA